MTVHNVYLPKEISVGAVGGYQFETRISQTQSGSETREAKREIPLFAGEIPFNALTEAQTQSFISFFNARRGRLYGFRFRFHADCTMTTETIATANGADTAFQIYHTYSDAGGSLTKTIYKPVSGTLHVYFGATEQTTGWSCNYDTGVITFTSPPPAATVIKVSCTFDLPVRFDSDYQRLKYLQASNFAWDSVGIVEIAQP